MDRELSSRCQKPETGAKVLVVDDDPTLLWLVGLRLEQEGYEVSLARDGREGLRQAYHGHPDLIILDVMMPEMDGWEVCRRLREMWDGPILMLTAKGELKHRLKGLGLGADDYMGKPFDMEELLLRVKALLRRARLRPPPKQPQRYDDGELAIDLGRGEVWREGQRVDLTPKEFKLLACLVREKGHHVPVERLLREVWGEWYGDGRRVVRVCIWGLRQKIEADPGHPRYIVTERGVGYRFQGNPNQILTKS
jgi:DNA-binding response OmpR family regulator